MTIWFASGNIHKKKELKDILEDTLSDPIHLDTFGREEPWKWELKIPSDAGIAFGPEETGSTFLENALLKAAELHRLLGEKNLLRPGDSVIADDSGICVDALGGRPGVHSAYYGAAGTVADDIVSDFISQRRKDNAEHAKGNDTDTKLSAGEQNALLLWELGDKPLRSGRFVCCMILYYSAERFFTAQETFEGELVKEMRGEGGFGYDPVLYIPELGRTVAELTAEEKNRWSHRGRAARTIADIIVGEILTAECQ